MTMEEFRASMAGVAPASGMAAPLVALWWDAKGDWRQAHAQVDDLGTKDAMAVHAYLHRKEGDVGNAGYWYRRAGRESRRGPLEMEWEALVQELLAG